MNSLLTPNWPQPPSVKAFCTTRLGGVSLGAYQSFNLADHVGDSKAAVQENRLRLINQLALPSPPCWLNQTHSTIVVMADSLAIPNADASIAVQPGQICVVLTADCLPILVSHRHGHIVAAIHAGWKGLLNGIIEATLERLPPPYSDYLIWLGPGIGPNAFELSFEVQQQFIAKNSQLAPAFTPNKPGHCLADIYQLATIILRQYGVNSIYGGEYCTVSEPQRFFSYRRDAITGRMASLIWIEN